MKIKDLFEEEAWTSESVHKWIVEHWDDEVPGVKNKRPPEPKHINVTGDKVSVIGSLYLKGTGTLPFQLSMHTDDGILYMTGFDSLKGCPELFRGFFCVRDVKSLEGAPKRILRPHSVAAVFDCESLKGIGDYIQEINGLISLGPDIKRNILGLLKIKNLSRVQKLNTMSRKHPEELSNAIEILNEHLDEGLKGFVKAQREMLDADLDDYAEE